jgi:hypothetical protein
MEGMCCSSLYMSDELEDGINDEQSWKLVESNSDKVHKSG